MLCLYRGRNMEELEINKAAEFARLKPHTLRYYESIGLIEGIKRNSAGKRLYSESDLKWLEVINRLRATGMSISKMQEYARLRRMGDATITERKNIMNDHLNAIEREIKVLLETKDYVAKKVRIYEEMEKKMNAKRN